MPKLKLTKELEFALLKKYYMTDHRVAFEVCGGITTEQRLDEIIDAVAISRDRTIRCFELKVSVADFRSKNALSFHGNYNYFVLTYDVYEKVKNEIPNEIGCLVLCDTYYDFSKRETVYKSGNRFLCSLKKAKRKELEIPLDEFMTRIIIAMGNRTTVYHYNSLYKSWKLIRG